VLSWGASGEQSCRVLWWATECVEAAAARGCAAGGAFFSGRLLGGGKSALFSLLVLCITWLRWLTDWIWR
jgi:hypothetical protein